VEHLLEADELRHLALHETAHGDPGPIRVDLGEVLIVDLLLVLLFFGMELFVSEGLLLYLVLVVELRAFALLRGLLVLGL
jgi:hypothetical protein